MLLKYNQQHMESVIVRLKDFYGVYTLLLLTSEDVYYKGSIIYRMKLAPLTGWTEMFGKMDMQPLQVTH